MSERKNIDRLFQEKFKEFEVTPPNDTWANIEAKLDGKKKRRIVPFWWKLSGVAAVFLIGFFLSKSIYDDGIAPQNPIVNENNSDAKDKPTIEDVHLKHLKSNNIPTEPGIVEQAAQNPIVNEANSGQKNQKSAGGLDKNNDAKSSKSAVATTLDENKNNTVAEEKNNKQKTVFSSKSSVAERKSTHNRSLKNKSNTEKEKTSITESDYEKSKQQLAQNLKNKQSAAENSLVQTDLKDKNNKETVGAVDPKNINLDGLKENINSKIASKEIEKKVNDTAAISVADNELEKLLNEKESKLKKESKINRWQLTSNVAPIFLGSVSNGSPIDPSLSKNAKSYNTNIGYGLGVSYALNKKFSVRTGLNKVNMGYDTNDISFFTGIQAKTLAAVNPNSSSALIHVESNTVPVTAVYSETGLLPFEANLVHKTSGYLRQEMGYIEMPVEMTYSLLDRKFGVKLIGGFSTLYLQDNNIILFSQDRETVLGEANNLNDLHFSTNLGLGLKYSFYKSFEFNVEPTVKYQLNTYNANAGSFKPYYFGIYSGISYKF